MWNAKEFLEVLERHPEGGTLWTRSHRTVRYIRVLRLDKRNIIAVMTEHTHFQKIQEVKVELFVNTPSSIQVSVFEDPSQTPEFLQRLLKDPILNYIHHSCRLAAEEFLSSPDKTALPTW